MSRPQKHLAVTITAYPTTTGLHLLVDSSGIKMLGEGEWKTKKHGADYRRQWRKVHLGIDATTSKIRAIEVTDNATGDAPMLPCLLDQIDASEAIASVSGMEPTTPRPAMRPLPYVAHRPLFQRAKTASPGKTVDRGLRHATPYCMPCGTWVVEYGRSGPATIDAVWWKVSVKPAPSLPRLPMPA